MLIIVLIPHFDLIDQGQSDAVGLHTKNFKSIYLKMLLFFSFQKIHFDLFKSPLGQLLKE